MLTEEIDLNLMPPPPALSQEVSPEVWKEVQLSTIELSITTRNSQLDLTVSVPFYWQSIWYLGKVTKATCSSTYWVLLFLPFWVREERIREKEDVVWF